MNKFSYAAKMAALGLTTVCIGAGLASAAPATSLYQKYGGEPTIQKVVNDAVVGLMGDPRVAPFFANVGQPGHNTPDQLTSCLDLQFTVLFGGPGQFPGISHYQHAPPEGYDCASMTDIHSNVAITNEAFDAFVQDLGLVMEKDGLQDHDLTAVLNVLESLRGEIVGGMGSQSDSVNHESPQTVAMVDLQKYSGRWYEIAHQQNDYESDCVRSIGNYKIPAAGQLSISNTCYLADGSHRTLVGIGQQMMASEAKFVVTFPLGAMGDYWITALDPKYQWAVVSAPHKDALFIISRTRRLNPVVLKELVLDLRAKGYDISKLVYDKN